MQCYVKGLRIFYKSKCSVGLLWKYRACLAFIYVGAYNVLQSEEFGCFAFMDLSYNVMSFEWNDLAAC